MDESGCIGEGVASAGMAAVAMSSESNPAVKVACFFIPALSEGVDRNWDITNHSGLQSCLVDSH